MRRALWTAVILLAGIAAYLLFWPVPVDPVSYVPSEDPGMTGPFVQNEALAGVRHLINGIGPGPEDITRGEDGYLYTGLQDGRIVG